MVGAVGIELKREEFQGLTRNAKKQQSLKRNDGERKGILIAPLKLPRFLDSRDFHSWISTAVLHEKSASDPNSAARMASRHWLG